MDRVKTRQTPTPGYGGDVDPEECWRVLANDVRAQLVDVRTRAEWTFVGLPDLSSIGKELLRLEWLTFPDGKVQEDFGSSIAGALQDANAGFDTPVFFICRSGSRSAAAARAATQAGLSAAYNVAFGFEGDLDANGHRAQTNGWKNAGLPWTQN